MSSIIKVDTVQDIDGNNIINENADVITVGASGDTITIPAGATFDSSAATNTLPATVVTTTGTQTLTNKSIVASQLTGTITPSDSTVTLAKLTATGTKDATTFLRGDNTFAVAGGTNTPAFDIRRNSYQTISSATLTKVALDAASLDTDSGFDVGNNRWTVPSGKGGTYYIAYSIFLDSGADANYQYGWGELQLNGAAITNSIADSRTNNTRQWSVSGQVVLALSVGDYLELFGVIADSSGSPQFGGGASGGDKNKTHLSGYKILT